MPKAGARRHRGQRQSSPAGGQRDDGRRGRRGCACRSDGDCRRLVVDARRRFTRVPARPWSGWNVGVSLVGASVGSGRVEAQRSVVSEGLEPTVPRSRLRRCCRSCSSSSGHFDAGGGCPEPLLVEQGLGSAPYLSGALLHLFLDPLQQPARLGAHGWRRFGVRPSASSVGCSAAAPANEVTLAPGRSSAASARSVFSKSMRMPSAKKSCSFSCCRRPRSTVRSSRMSRSLHPRSRSSPPVSTSTRRCLPDSARLATTSISQVLRPGPLLATLRPPEVGSSRADDGRDQQPYRGRSGAAALPLGRRGGPDLRVAVGQQRPGRKGLGRGGGWGRGGVVLSVPRPRQRSLARSRRPRAPRGGHQAATTAPSSVATPRRSRARRSAADPRRSRGCAASGARPRRVRSTVARARRDRLGRRAAPPGALDFRLEVLGKAAGAVGNDTTSD